MKYNEEWRSKEKFIDDKLAKRDQSKKIVLRKNLPGATVCDILIMSNWVVYAKSISSHSKTFKPFIVECAPPTKILISGLISFAIFAMTVADVKF